MPRSPQVHGTPNISRSTVEWSKLAPDVILKRNPPPYYQAWDWHDKGVGLLPWRSCLLWVKMMLMSGKMGLRDRFLPRAWTVDVQTVTEEREMLTRRLLRLK